MVLTKREDLYERLRMLRVHGMDNEPYRHIYLGLNSRLDEIKASALLVKLPFLEEWNRQRVEIATYYNARLKDLPIVLPELDSHVFHLYVIRYERRDELREFLQRKRIHTGIYYPLPLHLQPCFSFLGYKEGDFLEAERASKESLALPCYPGLKGNDLLYIVSSIREFFLHGTL
jgi:dTDP-4-amino-4,6-dideoxygalactose transaminase